MGNKDSFEMIVENEKKHDALCFNNIELYGNNVDDKTSSTHPIPFRTCSMPNVWVDEEETKIDDDQQCSDYSEFADPKSHVKCHLNSDINLSHLKIGLCNRNYAASYDPMEITICNESQDNCCTTDNLNYDGLFNSYENYEDGSYLKDIDTLNLGSCKEALLSNTVKMFVNVQGSDGLCVNYFQLGEKFEGSPNEETLTTCQSSEVYADSNKVMICPRWISYEKAPIHCQGKKGKTLQKIAIKVSDKGNAGSTDLIKFVIRNSDGIECVTKNLTAPENEGVYKEYNNFGPDCSKLKISEYVHLWVATVHHNDNLFLTHLYLDVVDEYGGTDAMACLLDQNEEFFVTIQGGKDRFGVPLKCM